MTRGELCGCLTWAEGSCAPPLHLCQEAKATKARSTLRSCSLWWERGRACEACSHHREVRDPGSHIFWIPHFLDPTFSGSHTVRIPHFTDPTFSGSHTLRIPHVSVRRQTSDVSVSVFESMLPFHAAVPCCRSMLPFHAAVPCCRSMSPFHVAVTIPTRRAVAEAVARSHTALISR